MQLVAHTRYLIFRGSETVAEQFLSGREPELTMQLWATSHAAIDSRSTNIFRFKDGWLPYW